MGRFPNEVTLWIDDRAHVDWVAGEARAEAVRVLWRARHGPPATVADAAGQEGLAGALSTSSPANSGAPDALTADALEAYADDSSLSAKASILYGDTAAGAFGFKPLGLADRQGLAQCAALARERLDGSAPEELLSIGWSPAALR